VPNRRIDMCNRGVRATGIYTMPDRPGARNRYKEDYRFIDFEWVLESKFIGGDRTVTDWYEDE